MSWYFTPGASDSGRMLFPSVGFFLKVFGDDYVRKLGVPMASPGLPPVTPRVFFGGFVDYRTLSKRYRLTFCFTPQDYAGTELIECSQWNETRELPTMDLEADARSHDK